MHWCALFIIQFVKMAANLRDISIAAALTLENVKNILDTSSSESGDDELFINIFTYNRHRREHIPRIRIQNYMDDVVLHLSDTEFKTHFRYVPLRLYFSFLFNNFPYNQIFNITVFVQNEEGHFFLLTKFA